MLTRKQLINLRKQVVLNSLFYKDYANDLYISEKTCCLFFDSYINYLYELATENNDNELDVLDVIKKYDNGNNLYNWYLCYENDPLIKDGYKAYIPENIYAGVFIYNIDYDINDSVIAATYYHDRNSDLIIDKLTRNRLYYDYKKHDYYFKKYGRRFYLSDALKDRR